MPMQYKTTQAINRRERFHSPEGEPLMKGVFCIINIDNTLDNLVQAICKQPMVYKNPILICKGGFAYWDWIKISKVKSE